MPSRLEYVPGEAAPSGDAAPTGRVVVLNKRPQSIWYLRVVTGDRGPVEGRDRLDAPILPGCRHALDLPPGLYRLVAETGGGATFRSTLMQVDPGGVARWEIGGAER